jgi:hypothetical protein
VLKVETLWELLADLGSEDDGAVPVVSLRLDSGNQLDVFRAEQVRERPIAWKVRGFSSDEAGPKERRAVLLGTTDGRAMLMSEAAQTSEDAPGGGGVVVGASAERRPLGDLADVIANAIRRRFE